MTHDLTYTENLLETIFSPNGAVDEEEQSELMKRVAVNSDGRERASLRTELEAALADSSFDWDELFDRLDVNIAPGEPARPYVVERIWVPLFGRDTVPAEAG